MDEQIRCKRAETTRDCRFNHHWFDGKAYKGRDHREQQPAWLRRLQPKDLTGQVLS